MSGQGTSCISNPSNESASGSCMKIGFCQLPDGVSPEDAVWKQFQRRVERECLDVLVLNEMPFGPWVASTPRFDARLAAASINAHDAALRAVRALRTPVISSRPVRSRGKLANEAFLLSDDRYRAIHHKQYFPHEPGFYEAAWFSAARPGFDVIEIRGIRFGVLLCTELMFTEWARHYRHQGAQVIVVPRASGTMMRHWDAAARMAAITSGCYVVSSNRVSEDIGTNSHFGGRGFAYSPNGEQLGETSHALPLCCVNVNLGLVTHAQRNYPCNVPELETFFETLGMGIS